MVAIDGLGGAGKSTLAYRVSERLGGVAVVHIDDFETPDGWLEGWPRVIEQVLRPLADGVPARYQRYDWDLDRLSEWCTVPTSDRLLLEGVGSSRSEFREFLAASVWVQAGPSQRLRRGLARDGEAARSQWLSWQAKEDAYVVRDNPEWYADLVVSGENGAAWTGPTRPGKAV